jgi:2-alkyl-3-oxoalkanoate reductase
MEDRTMKVMIAGSTGVLGRRLVQQFSARGDTVYGLTRSDDSAHRVRALGGVAVATDLFDAEAMARAVEHVDVVVHAATAIPSKTRTSTADWANNDRIRREGTVALTRYASMVGAQQYIQQSITWVARPDDGAFYDESSPSHPSPVTQSALDGEKIAQDAGDTYGFKASILRFGYFYSADSAHIRQIRDGLLSRRMPIIGRGDALISNIHVDDAASAIVASADSRLGGLWHVVDDQPMSVASLFATLAEKLGAPTPAHIPVWLARLLVGRTTVDLLTVSSQTSNSLFKRDTGWNPTYPTIDSGLDQVVAAWRNEGALPQLAPKTFRRAA